MYLLRYYYFAFTNRESRKPSNRNFVRHYKTILQIDIWETMI